MSIKKTSRIIGKVILWVLGIWIGLLTLIQIVLLPPIFTKIANSLANKYVNADVSIGCAYGSVFRRFPRISIEVRDLEITYPHERFDSLSRNGYQHHLLHKGCGEEADTLANIKKLSASVTLTSLLKGELRISQIELESPRIYAHSYDAEHANWDIFGSSESSGQSEPSEESESEDGGAEGGDGGGGLDIILGSISISGQSEIVYTDSQDSLFAKLNTKKIGIEGDIELNALHKTQVNAGIHDLRVSGRYGTDSLAVTLNSVKLTPHDKHMDLAINASAYADVTDFAIGRIPISLYGELSLPEDEGTALSLQNVKSRIGTLECEGGFDVRLRSDSTVVDAHLNIIESEVEPILNSAVQIFAPEIGALQSDTKVSLHATVNGAFNNSNGTMPVIDISLDVPESWIDNVSFPEKVNLGLTANLQMDKTGQVYIDMTKALLKTYGLTFEGSGSTSPLDNSDRKVNIDGSLRASLDSLRAFLPESMELTAEGGFTIDLDGTAKLSDLGMYKFSQAGLNGKFDSKSMILKMPEESLDLTIEGLDIRLKPEYVTSREAPDQTIRLMGISGMLGYADLKYKEDFSFKGKNIVFSAKNSTDQKEEDSKEVSYLGGTFNAGMIHLEDSHGTSIQMDDTKNRFQMHPDRKNPEIPVLSLSNDNLRITYVTPDNRVIITDSQIKAKAALNTFDRKVRREAFLDSLSNVYPEIPRDSLFRHMRAQRNSTKIPSWMAEDDFKENDIKIDINQTAKKYFREWDLEGDVGIRTGIIMTPYLPLRNIIRGFNFRFTNDVASIDSLKIVAGRSELCAKGRLSNIKRATLRNDTLKLDMDIFSRSVNADELLKAFSAGSHYEPAYATDMAKKSDKELTNAEFFKQVTNDTIQNVQTTSSLVVLPGNIDADIRIRMSGAEYQDLEISNLMSDIKVKERCAQITGGVLKSNMGNGYLDAFYSVKNKHDIKSGFCLTLEDVTSEKVISMMPEIGEVIPMISSLNGLLFCEIAATAELDTTMSIKMPTVNGIARLGGKNLTISDDPVYTSVAKKLLFKNKKRGEIKDLMIEGAIQDNSLKVFPFILKLDRYTLGLSGVQNMDMSYKHHISVLRSPLLIRLGLNLSGPDYDHMKFKLGKAKYRIKKMPSFTAVIDQTRNDLRYSIYNLFETGVNQTIANSDVQSLINEYETHIGYVNAANLELEELDEKELSEFQKMEAADAMVEDAMTAAMAAIQEALKKHKYE